MKPIILCLYLVFGFNLSAQDVSQYQKKVYQNPETSYSLPYRILFPENYNASKKYPLILVLHGAGERGADNERQLTHGSTLFLQEINRKNFPSIVVFPQCPENEFWSSAAIDRSTKPVTFVFDYSLPPTASLTNVTGLITKLIKEEGVDASKVYITGLSMGGMGTFEMVYRNPNLFAAAMPICGGGDTGRYDQRILKTSFWIFHGGLDPVVDVKWSREMVDKLKQLNGDVTYSEYPAVQHDSWTNAFAEPKFMSWLFSHQRR